jgi:hypothetical protein
MDQQTLIRLGMALGACWAAYKFSPNAQVKGAVLGIAGVIVAKQMPVVKNFV